jgi:outer membrane protein TolC
MRYLPRPQLALLALAVLALSGCASFSPDGGLDAVSQLTQQRTGQAVKLSKGAPSDEDASHVHALLAAPLTPDSAVQIALINNAGLKASFEDLGVSEADLVQAGRLRNPGISFTHVSGGGDTEVDRSVTLDLAGILVIPLRRGIEKNRFEQAKLETAMKAAQLAADTRRAFFTAVAAQQTAQFMEQVAASAEASAELARRMAKVGNWSKLDQAREQVFYAETVAQQARAQQNFVSAREQLTRLLGLTGEQLAFTLPDRLPDLPKEARVLPDAETQAMSQRLDVQVAKRNVDAMASSLGLTRATGFINVLDAGYADKRTTGLPIQRGYTISLELPIFDWGSARTAKAEALYMGAVQRTADAAIRAQSEVREAYASYRTSYDLARHYRDEIVPLRKQISDEMLLRYNGMLASTFELLADSRDQMTSVNAAIETQRDFWIADAALQSAMTSGPTNSQMSTAQ